MPGPFRAVETGASLRNEVGVALGERRRGQLQEDVVLDPLLKVANREQDALRFAAVAVLFLIAGFEGIELLFRLEFGQQESMTDADLVFGKSFDDFGCKLRQPKPGSDVCGTFPALGADLFDTVLRFFEPHQGGKALCFVEWMYIPSLQVFDDAGLKSLGVAEFDDAYRRGFQPDNLRGPEAPGPCDNLEMLADRAHNQGREDPLCSDALGQLIERRFIEFAAWIVCRLCQAFERKIAILGCGNHVRFSFSGEMG